MSALKMILGSSSRSAAAMFAFIFIAIGVPLWWKTTEVYRVNLPYDEIQQLQQFKVNQRFDVAVIYSKNESDNKILQDVFQYFVSTSDDEKTLMFNYKWSVRKMYSEENVIFKEAKSLQDFDNGLNKLNLLNNSGMIWIYVLDQLNSLIDEKSDHKIGQHRAIFIENTIEPEKLAMRCINIVQNAIVRESSLVKTLNKMKDSRSVILKPDKEQMRSVHATPAYDLTFSLVQDDTLVDWDIADAINEYFQPFVDKLSKFAEFNIKSQMLYLTNLNINPKWDGDKQQYMLYPEQLPHVINPIEELLGSHTSTNPALNFLIYIPSRKQSPLRIYDDKGQLSTTNAFVSPRWGGFIIYNMNESESSINMSQVMGVFLSQLRLLLGLPQTPPSGLPLDRSSCSDWEFDFLLRRRTLENLATSVSSLNSLAQLLEKIRNIVINDDVGTQIYDAIKTAKQSLIYLEEGDLLSAFEKSKASFIASEKAFFDPSLLQLLYFPDDQKYAIYIPLFLPVSIPILTSLLSLYKSLKSDKLKKE